MDNINDTYKVSHTQKYSDLFAIVREIIAFRKLDNVLETIAEKITILINADKSLILLVDEVEGKIWKPWGYNYDKEHVESLSYTELMAGLSGWVLRNKQPAITNRAQEDIRQTGPALKNAKKYNTKSVIVVPMWYKGQIIGTITATNPYNKPNFTEYDMNLVAALADHASIAIENARLFYELSISNTRMQSLIDANSVIVSELEIEGVLKNIINSAIEAFPNAQRGCIHIYDKNTDLLKLKATTYGDFDTNNLVLEFKPGEGIAGWVFHNNKEVIISNAIEDWRFKKTSYPESQVYKSIICVPLRGKKKIIGVLTLVNFYHEGIFTESDGELLYTFANQAAIAIDNANTYHAINRHSQLSQELIEKKDFNEQLECVWNYVSDVLNAPMFFVGIYYEHVNEVNFLIAYDNYKKVSLPSISLENRKQWGLSGYVVNKEKKIIWMNKDERIQIQNDINITPHLEGIPSNSCIVIPLKTENKIIGVMSIQSEINNAWDNVEINTFETLATQVTSVIQKDQLFQQILNEEVFLYNAYVASKQISSSLEPDSILQSIVDYVKEKMGAWRASIILINKNNGDAERLLSVGFNRNMSIETEIRENGISRSVIDTKKPIFIEDTYQERELVHQAMISDGVRSAICLPFVIRDESRGVIWIHFKKPQIFSNAKKDAWLIFSNHAAIAFRNARIIKELERIWRTSNELASAQSIDEVIKQTLLEAKQVFEADSAIYCYYDETNEQFDKKRSIASGLDPEIWKVLQNRDIKFNSTNIKEIVNHIHFLDISQDDDALVKIYTAKSIIKKIGVQKLIGIPINIGAELLGFLILNYKSLINIDDDDFRNSVKTFAYQTSISIKKALLLEQLEKTISTAGSVANLSVIGNLKITLEHIVKETCKVLKCDQIVIYTYDERKDKFGFPPTMVGVKHQEKVIELDYVEKNSVPYKVLSLKQQIYIAESKDDEVMKGEFRKREGVISSVAAILGFRKQKVGLMFINYQKKHIFTKAEITDLMLFANQAAIAIHNAYQFDADQRHISHLNAIHASSKVITANASAEREELLTNVLKEAVDRISLIEGKKASMGVIQTYNAKTNEIIIESVYPPKASNIYPIGHKRVLKRNKGEKIGITGRAILSKKPILKNDVNTDPDYLEFNKDTMSELDVPIFDGDEVIGVISLESNEIACFDQEDERAVIMLAELAVIAIKNSKQYHELKEIKGLVGSRSALAWMGMASSTWRHSIEGQAINIRNILQILRELYPQECKDHKNTNNIFEKFALIDQLIDEILKKPITPPLSSEEGIEKIFINDLIEERVTQLWANEKYKSNQHELIFSPENPNIECSPEWIKRAFDNIIDNAVKSMNGLKEKKLTITTIVRDKIVEIRFIDNGIGIPKEIVSTLFKEQIKKPSDKGGLGMGLLITQAIIQTFGGEIDIEYTGEYGTIILIKMPIYIEQI